MFKSLPPLSRRWLANQGLLLLASAMLLLLVFENTSLDMDLARALYDPELGNFPLRKQWFIDYVLYRGAKQASYVAVAATLYFCYQGYKGQLEWLPRRNAILAAIGMVAIPLGTTLLKGLTNRHCPWDVIDFGGYAPYLGLLTSPPEGMKGGECFPAGHASAGFLWIVWGVALRPAGRRMARWGLLAGLLLGGILGTARMVQGAHFLSHTFWSLWFAWTLSIILAILLKAELGFPQTTASAPEDTDPDYERAYQAD